MRRLTVLGLLLFTLSSMQRESSAELLTKNQMVSILVDLELAKAMVAYYTDDEATASQLLNKNMLLICQTYDIRLNTFQESCQYYFTQLEVIKEIYEAVIKRLEELEAQG